MKKPTRVTHPPVVELPEGNSSLVSPVYRSVKFTHESIEQSLSKEMRENGFDYTRDANPTTRELELLCAELQDREDGLAVATGMAAVWLTLLGNLQAGDRIVIFLETYRPTRVCVRRFLPRLGIEHTMVSVLDSEATEAALADPRAKLLLFESPTNPMMHVPDIEKLVSMAKRHDVMTVLDNTFAGLHSHGRFDIDYFVHSLTKFASGHGDTMGGIVIGSRESVRRLRPLAVNMGSTIDPGGSFLILRGLKTYYMRYRQHCENALAIAEFLQSRAEVERVHYPGLPDDPGHALATRQMEGYGGVLSFELSADKEKTWAFIDALELFATTASLGSTESLVAPVKLYLGRDLSAQELEQASITDSTVRLAVGTEDVSDLIADLTQALERVFA
jgi:cystathionine beta-lyase/cystathionine gamma-synthase